MKKPRHADEYSVFKNFREMEDASHFITLFNEHTSLDEEFVSRSDLDRFISNDYPKMTEKEQAKFIKDMEKALSDHNTDFDKIDEDLVRASTIKKEKLAKEGQ